MADDRDRSTDQLTTEAPGTPAPAGTATAADRPLPRHVSHMPPPDGDEDDDDYDGRSGLGLHLLGSVHRRIAGILATAISMITTVVVAMLAVHIVFVAFEANPANELVTTVAEWAEGMAWQFKDVFQPADPKLEVAVNYGLAAVVYLVLARAVIGLFRRLD